MSYFGTPGAVSPSALQIRENVKFVEHFYGTAYRQIECRIFGTPGAVFQCAVQIRENVKFVEHFYGTAYRQTECRILEHPVKFSRARYR